MQTETLPAGANLSSRSRGDVINPAPAPAPAPATAPSPAPAPAHLTVRHKVSEILPDGGIVEGGHGGLQGRIYFW